MGDRDRVINIGEVYAKADRPFGTQPERPVLTEQSSGVRVIFNELNNFLKVKEGNERLVAALRGLALEIAKHIASLGPKEDAKFRFDKFVSVHVSPVAEQLRGLKMFSEAADLASLVQGLINKHNKLGDL